MELNSKQRARLRAMANSLDPVLHVGKGDLTENLIQQADATLEARELMKCRVLETAESSVRETAEALAKATRSEIVQVIGSTFLLFRQSHKKGKKTILTTLTA